MENTNPRAGQPLPESRFSVVLVEPQIGGNVGHTARCMLNFGIGDLVIVAGAGAVTDEARQRAVHAQDVLDHARFFDSLDDVKKEIDVLVGFASRVSALPKAHLRMSETLEDVAKRVSQMGGRIGLVFGREDFGLSNEDVEKCDILCSIPTQPSYRSMNLSHAVSVALYEMTRGAHAQTPYLALVKPHEKDVLFATFNHLNATVGFKPHRVEQGDIMFRRVVGRAGLTAWEYHRLMGTLTRSLKRMKAWPPPGVGEGVYTERPADEDVERPQDEDR